MKYIVNIASVNRGKLTVVTGLVKADSEDEAYQTAVGLCAKYNINGTNAISVGLPSQLMSLKKLLDKDFKSW